MPRLSASTFSLPLAAALLASAVPAAALTIGNPPPPRDPYAVPPPPGCAWGTSVIPHTTPPVRPVVITPNQSVWSIRSVAGQPSPGPWPSRSVSFTYNLTQLDRRVPTGFDGSFVPDRVTVEVFDVAGNRMWSRLHTGGFASALTSVAASASTVQPSRNQYGAFDSLWLLRVTSIGNQIVDGFKGGTPPRAMVIIDCELRIQPPPPPVVGP
jgi:hypothetical protein